MRSSVFLWFTSSMRSLERPLRLANEYNVYKYNRMRNEVRELERPLFCTAKMFDYVGRRNSETFATGDIKH